MYMSLEKNYVDSKKYSKIEQGFAGTRNSNISKYLLTKRRKDEFYSYDQESLFLTLARTKFATTQLKYNVTM